MQLKSSAFENRSQIPPRYTGEGQDVSPPLKWSRVPEGCREYALVCEDPDAPVREGKDHPFVHWLIFHISPSTTSLPEGVVTQGRLELPIRADQGANSWGKIGYGGPMPPIGHGEHRYIFTLYALDTSLGLPPGATKKEFLKAIHGHVIEETKLIGVYERYASQVAI